MLFDFVIGNWQHNIAKVDIPAACNFNLMTSSRARIAPSPSNSHHSLLSLVAHFALLINLAYLNRGRFVTRKIQRPAATLLIIGYPLTRLSRHRVARIRNRPLKVGPAPVDVLEHRIEPDEPGQIFSLVPQWWQAREG